MPIELKDLFGRMRFVARADSCAAGRIPFLDTQSTGGRRQEAAEERDEQWAREVDELRFSRVRIGPRASGRDGRVGRLCRETDVNVFRNGVIDAPEIEAHEISGGRFRRRRLWNDGGR